VEFRTGWFVESIATQTLVVYVIRTRRVPFFKSRPSVAMILVPTGAAIVGALLPYTGLAHLFGFSVLPTKFFLLLFGMVVVYLALVEYAKLRFFQSQSPRLAVTTTTDSQRLNRRIMRRASRFIRHEARRCAECARPRVSPVRPLTPLGDGQDRSRVNRARILSS